MKNLIELMVLYKTVTETTYGLMCLKCVVNPNNLHVHIWDIQHTFQRILVTKTLFTLSVTPSFPGLRPAVDLKPFFITS